MAIQMSIEAEQKEGGAKEEVPEAVKEAAQEAGIE